VAQSDPYTTQTPGEIRSTAEELHSSASGADRRNDGASKRGLRPIIGSEAEFELWLLATLERERATIIRVRNG
jgi:hypothetical protein